jgi:hypothetical protein
MSPAATPAAITGSMIAAAERRLLCFFLDRDATAPERVVAYQPRRGMPAGRFRHLRRRGVLVETEPGLFYLDEDAWRRLRSQRRRAALLVLAILVLLLLAILLIGALA